MNAEKYLERIAKIDELIPSKQSRVDELREIAEGLGGFSSGESVQSSKNLQKQQDAIAKYCDLEREIKALESERESIIKTLERLPAYDYGVLSKLYAEKQSYKVIASYYKKSYDWVKWRRKTALGKLQAILDEEKSTV